MGWRDTHAEFIAGFGEIQPPETLDQLIGEVTETHRLACGDRHLPGCADFPPADDDWNGWVAKLAGHRARIWWNTVAVQMWIDEEAPDVKDLDTCTLDKVPPDTTSHLYRRMR